MGNESVSSSIIVGPLFANDMTRSSISRSTVQMRREPSAPDNSHCHRSGERTDQSAFVGSVPSHLTTGVPASIFVVSRPVHSESKPKWTIPCAESRAKNQRRSASESEGYVFEFMIVVLGETRYDVVPSLPLRKTRLSAGTCMSRPKQLWISLDHPQIVPTMDVGRCLLAVAR